jgi:hypothetical protein
LLDGQPLKSRTRSRSSTRGSSPSRRGGQRSGTSRPKGQTKEQLYNQAKRLKIQGRSSMSKRQLQRAVAEKSAESRFTDPGQPVPAEER